MTGTEEQVEKAKKALEPLIQLQKDWESHLTEAIQFTGSSVEPFFKSAQNSAQIDAEIRIKIQDIIDTFNLTAIVVHKGHKIWSRKRIISNLHKIKTQGPEHLSNYFYEFIKEICGSKLYFNKAAWIKAHPTVDAFGQFFLKNDYGKDTCEYIPEWKADAKRIVTDIERTLFPFQSYVKNKNKRKT